MCISRVIRQKSDNRFLALDGDWTGNPDEAVKFRDYHEAVAAANGLKLHDVELIYTSTSEDGMSSDSFSMPLT